MTFQEAVLTRSDPICLVMSIELSRFYHRTPLLGVIARTRSRDLRMPLEMLPVSMSMLEPHLKTLAAFGCDIHLIGREGNMPLWVKDSGYEPTALDLLVQRCKGWFAIRQEECRIKRGDRVAILGRGIALVEQVNDKHVHLILWNRNVLRIFRKEIVWDDGNMRWEAGQSLMPRTKS